MSSLNSEATKALLLEEDVLSSFGRIGEIWDLYTKNVNFQNGNNDILRVILNSLKSNVIDHLQLSDEELETCVSKFSWMVADVCHDMTQNELSVFLLVLAHALSEYSSVKSDLIDNIEINMESVSEVSQLDEMKIVSAMERYGLLDSVGLQSLLDDRNSALATACSEISRRWGKGSPSEEGCDAANGLPLALVDFIAPINEIYLKAREMFVFPSMITDNFPDVEFAMKALISPTMNVEEERFYHPKFYLLNLANLKILTATSQYICSLMELDTTTAIYTLNEVKSKINELVNQIGPVSSLLFSQLIVDAMLIRYLVQERGEGAPDTKILVDKLRNQLAELVNQLDCRADSFIPENEMKLFRSLPLVDDYVLFVASAAASGDVSDGKDAGSPQMVSGDELDAATNDLLASLDEVYCELTKVCSGDAMLVAESAGLMDALSPSIKSSVGQASDGYTLPKDISAVVECGTSLHNELNQALLIGDRETAANTIAREIAFEQKVLKKENMQLSADAAGTMQTISENISRDISTYSALLESVPGGIAKYKESAASYIDELLKMTET